MISEVSCHVSGGIEEPKGRRASVRIIHQKTSEVRSGAEIGAPKRHNRVAYGW